MKKLFSLLLVAALLLPVLAGCQRSEASQPATTAPAPTQQITVPATQQVTVPTTQPAAQYITTEEAKTIALQDAALQETEIRDLEVELDLDDGPVHYDVDFEKDGYDYDYEIDATTGKILKSHKERD